MPGTDFATATFVVDLRFERTVTGKDVPLVSAGILVQRPPRRIVRAFGNESSVVAEGAQTCELGVDATSLCTAAHPTDPYDVQVAKELTILSQYFSGDSPLYRVEAPTANCFRLFLYRAMPLPPYGDAAQFCFDNATGAMTLFESTTAAGGDRTIAQGITTTVTEADFDRTEPDAMPVDRARRRLRARWAGGGAEAVGASTREYWWRCVGGSCRPPPGSRGPMGAIPSALQ